MDASAEKATIKRNDNDNTGNVDTPGSGDPVKGLFGLSDESMPTETSKRSADMQANPNNMDPRKNVDISDQKRVYDVDSRFDQQTLKTSSQKNFLYENSQFQFRFNRRI